MDYRQTLINAFDSYCEKSGLAPATVSTRVVNDGKFYDGLTKGKGVTMKRFERAMQWFRENKPPKRTNGKNGHG